MEREELFAMKLHETKIIDCEVEHHKLQILRVYNGWIYTYISLAAYNAPTLSTFVPEQFNVDARTNS